MKKRQPNGRILPTSLLLIALAGCGGGEREPPIDITFSRPSANLYGDWPVRNFTIRTELDWYKAWVEHDSRQSPAPQIPIIDFSKNMLLGVSLGWGPNGCHGLAITRAQQTADALRVEYRHLVPSGPDVICSQSLVPLVDFVELPQSELPISFIEVLR